MMIRQRWMTGVAALAATMGLLVAMTAGCERDAEVIEGPIEIGEELPMDGTDAVTEPAPAAQDGATGEIVMVGESDFEQVVLNATMPVLVDFYADWCPPCRALQPTLEELARDFAGRAIVVKVDVDENQDLAAQYSVRSIPTLVVIVAGEEVDRTVGAQSKQVLAGMLDKQLN